jgi:16S rRNA (guanine527-N7)-methyltransferase
VSAGPAATRTHGDWPDSAAQLFGERLPLAECLAEVLTTVGIERGLLGPREAARIWERHLINCAVVSDLLPAGARVVDVGSGAGLPGLVLAVRRPDLRVDLVESLKRRTEFLAEAVATLGLAGQVRVVHGRAEDAAVIEAVGGSAWVTARAVAPLDRLVRWCLPLLSPSGQLLAMKGSSAAEELATHRDSVRRAGGRDPRILRCAVPGTAAPVLVVSVTRADTRGKEGSS